MSIEFRSTGSILDHADDDGWVCLVDPVNCVEGVMGRGLAKAFADRWPHIVKSHRAACRDGLAPGGIYELNAIESHIWVILFATKDHWRDPSRLEWIASGLAEFAMLLADFGDEKVTVAMPAIGCGLGGLDWAQVRPLIESMAGAFPQHRFVVYEPQGR